MLRRSAVDFTWLCLVVWTLHYLVQEGTLDSPTCCPVVLTADSFREQLTEDSSFLRSDRRLDTELVDKVILQLNRIYPQILTDKEATKVVDTHILIYL